MKKVFSISICVVVLTFVVSMAYAQMGGSKSGGMMGGQQGGMMGGQGSQGGQRGRGQGRSRGQGSFGNQLIIFY